MLAAALVTPGGGTALSSTPVAVRVGPLPPLHELRGILIHLSASIATSVTFRVFHDEATEWGAFANGGSALTVAPAAGATGTNHSIYLPFDAVYKKITGISEESDSEHDAGFKDPVDVFVTLKLGAAETATLVRLQYLYGW